MKYINFHLPILNTTFMKRYSIFIIGGLFFIFGFVTWLNSVLIPFLKHICELSDFQAYLVTFAFYISYFITAIPSSFILKKIGFVKGMSLGLAIMGLFSLLFIPAALSRNYLIFLIALFGQGVGLSILQTASNPYVTILGPIDRAAQRMSIMGICNKFAGIISIFLLGSLLFSNINISHMLTLNGEAFQNELNLIAHRLIMPYILMAAILFILAFVVLKSHLPEVETENNNSNAEQRPLRSYTYLWLGILALFSYVGAEVVAIDTLPLYGEYMGLKPEIAVELGSYSLFALVAGYIIGISTIPRFISQKTGLAICGILGLIFLIGALATNGMTSIIFIILLSFANAMIWPAIWPLAIEGLGKHTAIASAFLIMAIAGGAILPLIYGLLADATNRQIPYAILLPIYAYLIFFALRGCKIGKNK